MKEQNLTFGLDVGSNSLGWAVVQTANGGGRVVATGVRIFPEGVDRDKSGGEKSKNEQRRDARAMRRQIARRARRKRRLREALVQAGLLPEAALRKPTDPERVSWERDEYDKNDPYALRAKALSEKLTPFELGRVFLHLGQRRGFLSNRKKDKSANDKSELLASMSELAEKMGSLTLGQYLADQRSFDERLAIRGLHTRRVFGDNYLSPLATIKNPHRGVVKTLRRGGLVKRSEPERRSWSQRLGPERRRA